MSEYGDCEERSWRQRTLELAKSYPCRSLFPAIYRMPPDESFQNHRLQAQLSSSSINTAKQTLPI